jgi:hypothetical protein
MFWLHVLAVYPCETAAKPIMGCLDDETKTLSFVAGHKPDCKCHHCHSLHVLCPLKLLKDGHQE